MQLDHLLTSPAVTCSNTPLMSIVEIQNTKGSTEILGFGIWRRKELHSRSMISPLWESHAKCLIGRWGIMNVRGAVLQKCSCHVTNTESPSVSRTITGTICATYWCIPEQYCSNFQVLGWLCYAPASSCTKCIIYSKLALQGWKERIPCINKESRRRTCFYA